jgi:hypothetical protein
MDASEREAITARARSLVERHFELLNLGDLAAARQQLFSPPGLAEGPFDRYLETMHQLAPFRRVSVSVSRFEDVRRKRHGDVATVWLRVGVVSALGERSADLAVYWLPDRVECKISARPSHWVLEKVRQTDATE